jgi:hypothetical protein
VTSLFAKGAGKHYGGQKERTQDPKEYERASSKLRMPTDSRFMGIFLYVLMKHVVSAVQVRYTKNHIQRW